MVRLLIVGATGTLGQEVARACAEEGHQVFALVRAATRNTKAELIAKLEAFGI